MHSLSLTPRGLRAAIAFAALATTAVASAGVYIPTPFNIPSETTDWTKTVQLGRFDSSLGTLLSAEIFITTSVSTTLSFSNLSTSSPTTITGFSKGGFTVTNNEADKSVFAGFSGSAQSSIQGKTYAVNSNHSPKFDGVIGEIIPDVTASKTFTNSWTNAGDLGYFVGASPLSLDIAIQDLSETDSGNNIFADHDTEGSASGYIVYTYQAVPEPASMAALGFGALAMLRRRRSAK